MNIGELSLEFVLFRVLAKPPEFEGQAHGVGALKKKMDTHNGNAMAFAPWYPP